MSDSHCASVGILDVHFAHNQLATGLQTGREDQAESMRLPNKHSVYLMFFRAYIVLLAGVMISVIKN